MERDDPPMQLRSVSVVGRPYPVEKRTKAVMTPVCRTRKCQDFLSDPTYYLIRVSLQRAMLPMSDVPFLPQGGDAQGCVLIRSKR
jgi:hypothetical protein